MEVASTISCFLHSLEFKVIALVDDKLSINFKNVFRLFSQNWKKDCQSLYGQCVSEWIDISKPNMFRLFSDLR